MADSADIQRLVVQALAQKMPNVRCPLCGSDDWNVQLGTTYLPLKIQTGFSSSWNQSALPAVALICGNCGNTHMLNLRVLLPDLQFPI